MLRKLPIIAVFGQGTPLTPERERLAAAVGAMVARLGAHLLTGGGYGVMAAAATGFVAVADRPGSSIGIVPCGADGPMDRPNRDAEGRAYPNAAVEIAIMTPLRPRVGDWRNNPARNHINVFTAHAIIALPGGPGTRNELDMAAAYLGEGERSRGERRTVLIGPPAEFTPEHRAGFLHADTTEAAEPQLRRILEAHGFGQPHEAGARGDP